MKITYGKQLSFENWKRFACELAKKGAYITNGACSVNPEEHQFREMTNEDTTYNIIVDLFKEEALLVDEYLNKDKGEH